MTSDLDYIVYSTDTDLNKKIQYSLEKYGFCITKNFFEKHYLQDLIKEIQQTFSIDNDIRISGPLKYKMDNFQRLDLGDYKQENARFCRMLTYFTWNKDSIMFDVMKKLIDFRNDFLGLSSNDHIYDIEREKLCNLPKLLQYPIGGGFMNKHTDGVHYHGIMNVLLSLSKRGKDFQTGGVYYHDKEDNFIDVENIVDVGDIYFHDVTTIHGVKAIDPQKNIDLENFTGRLAINLSLVEFQGT